jgi:hypothetical protein
LRFAVKRFQRFGSCDQIVWKKFQRNMAFEAEVIGFIHHTHSAATQLLQDFVVRNPFPDQ